MALVITLYKDSKSKKKSEIVYEKDNKSAKDQSKTVVDNTLKEQATQKSSVQFQDNRPESVLQQKLQQLADHSEQVQEVGRLEHKANKNSSLKGPTLQKKENKTGLPDELKAGIEDLSGHSMDDVKVHYNSNQPQQLKAHAYAQGTDIHLASGQEKHLAHEAWHVVQQKQGRVRPTVQTKKGVAINDDIQLEKEADIMGARALAAQTRSTDHRKSENTNANSLQLKAVVQRLTDEEKRLKVKNLEDYVRITPPTAVPDGYKVPETRDEYYAQLLKKIRSNGFIEESLKSKKNMQADDEDDNWTDGSYNCITLKAAVEKVYTPQLKGDGAKIGKVYTPFNEHDCVWAALSHVRGQVDDLAQEKEIADEFNHEYGEVDDAVLYRIIEILGYPMMGKGSWDDFFGESLFESSGQYIVSENKDAGGTSGHVFVVEPKDDKVVTAYDAQTDQWQIYDRQYERTSGKKRPNFPQFDIYVWKVK